ncbi:MAG: hydrogenase maturation nickel metallochaperone HypA [Gammaproteobacteria bacterium]|nr:hydrogenase maturation nickel metallochaperone HypA [Gammaproteobacteria bacterium]
MHEMSTCRRILREVSKITTHHKDKRLTRITLEVGDLARIDVDELQELFPLATQGTPYEGVGLHITRVPTGFRCADCQQYITVTDTELSCPHCGSSRTVLESGTDMTLKELEFE